METRCTDHWVFRTRPEPDALLRLFCFPYAGGGTTAFHGWPDYLQQGVEVCSIMLPGREARLAEPPISRLPPLVEALSEAMLGYLDRPFVFFGHSMGALLAFELARCLRRKRRPTPAHLFVSGCVAPQLRDPGIPVHELPHEAFVEELRALNGTPEEVLRNEEMLALFLPALRADLAHAKASLALARIELEHARRIDCWLQRLYDSRTVSEDQLDEARYGFQAAAERVRVADADEAKAEALLKESRLVAPFDAVMAERRARSVS